MKQVYIRTDSSSVIGTGHVMRCITLARALKQSAEVNIHFICRDLEGNINSLIKKNGFEVTVLNYAGAFEAQDDAQQTAVILSEAQRQPSWLVVDHYAIENNWFDQLRPMVKQLMAVDDLVNRKLNVDLLLNQNLLPGLEDEYKNLVSDNCKLFLGPQYALLRDEFYKSNANQTKSDSILVFFGGADHTGETVKILPALEKLADFHPIDIITGNSNKDNLKIEAAVADNQHITHHCQVDNMSHYISKAVFAIGAGGATCLERMFFYLPTITIITAKNQLEATQYYHSKGLVENLGWYHQVSSADVYKASMNFIKNPEILLKYRANMKKIAVGSKGAKYVAQAMIDEL